MQRTKTTAGTLTLVGGREIRRLEVTDLEILSSVEEVLRAQGHGQTVVEPRVHLMPDSSTKGHFNVLRGYVAPLKLVGVKIVGDYVDNYRHGLRSEMAVLNLFNPDTGMPIAVLDASDITDMRTGAVTALGGKYLAKRNSRVLAHIGSRGTAYWNVRLLSRLFEFDEIRVHSRRAESRIQFAERLKEDLKRDIKVMSDWESCVRGADIVVEATRLDKPTPLLKTEWIKKSALVIPYGTMSAVELSLTDIMGKVVVDDWGQCRTGQMGALRPHVEAGKLHDGSVHAELGDIVAGRKAGRTSDDETILFWHRGLSTTDIALGALFLAKAEASGIATTLQFL